MICDMIYYKIRFISLNDLISIFKTMNITVADKSEYQMLKAKAQVGAGLNK